MKVAIKQLNTEMPLKNKGMEIEVRDNTGKHRGDLIVTKAKVVWCQGRTSRENGVAVSWDDLIDFFNSQP